MNEQEPFDSTTDNLGVFKKPARHRPERNRPLTPEDTDDIEAAREALKEESTPWDAVEWLE